MWYSIRGKERKQEDGWGLKGGSEARAKRVDVAPCFGLLLLRPKRRGVKTSVHLPEHKQKRREVSAKS